LPSLVLYPDIKKIIEEKFGLPVEQLKKMSPEQVDSLTNKILGKPLKLEYEPKYMPRGNIKIQFKRVINSAQVDALFKKKFAKIFKEMNKS
jgi:hypothetical protein